MKHEIIEKNIGLMALLMVPRRQHRRPDPNRSAVFQDVTNEPVEGLKPVPRCNWKAAMSTSPTVASAATRR